jgi:hypothetical protein
MYVHNALFENTTSIAHETAEDKLFEYWEKKKKDL